MRILLLFCSLILVAFPSHAVQRFITNTATGCTFPASDYNPATNSCPGGTDIAYDTPQACADATAPGDSCEFRAGNYDQVMTANNEIYITVSISGTAGSPIVYKAYNNEIVNIRCQDATTPNNFCFDDNDDGTGDAIGPRFTGGRLIQINADWIEVRDLNFRYAARWALDGQGDNNVYENLLFDANWEFAMDIKGTNTVTRYIEAKYTRRGSGILTRPVYDDSLIEYVYLWRNGYEEFCHTGTGQPCKVLPFPGDGAGGGNSDGLAFKNECHDGKGVGNNECNRNIVRYAALWKNADDGLDHSARDTLFYRVLSMDNGPEGNRGIKVLRDVYGANQYVDSIAYGNRQPSAVGFEHRQDNSATTRSLYLHNLAMWNGNRGMQLLKPQLGTLQSNLGTDNDTTDIFVQTNCDGATADCITNWAEDGSANIPLTGDPQLTNPNLWRVGNEIIFTIPPSEDTIQKRVEWIFAQVQAAFTPAEGSGLIDAGTGTSVTWTNPQTLQQESRPCVGTCDIGPFEFGGAPPATSTSRVANGAFRNGRLQ